MSEILKYKAEARNITNNNLIIVAFTVFTLIATLKPSLLVDNKILTLQLVLSIPFLLSSICARTTLGTTKKVEMWDRYGFATFLVGYAFLINAVGLLLVTLSDTNIGLIFFIMNIVLAIAYSLVKVIETRTKIKDRILKDIIFILLLIFFGILPALGRI